MLTLNKNVVVKRLNIIKPVIFNNGVMGKVAFWVYAPKTGIGESLQLRLSYLIIMTDVAEFIVTESATLPIIKSSLGVLPLAPRTTRS
jgi:hypothetical protein